MKPLKVYQILLWSAIEYVVGYEFPVLRRGEWKVGGQWKLDPFIDAPCFRSKQAEKKQC